MNNDKQIIFSGIQPSGVLTLGNYLGALRNWRKLQDEYNCYYCVVDMHAITVRQDAPQLRRRCNETMALLVASGLDPKKNTMFFQSHVSAHAELSWILNCNTYMGELSRMTQFKDKSARHANNVNAGLFTYPVLMAADILLYGSHLVPVGNDQKQHLELSRDIAIRFNNAYGDTFVVPDGYYPKVGARIMSLQEPTKKMSKSDENVNGFISMMDDEKTIINKVKRAVTDSLAKVDYNDEQLGLKNLINIYCACTNKEVSEALNEFGDVGYGVVKQRTAEAVVEVLAPIQKEYAKIISDKTYLKEIATEGREKAGKSAYKMLNKVYRKVGLAPR